VTSPPADNDLQDVEFEEDEDTETLAEGELQRFDQAVVSGTDWTIGTVVDQLDRGNIDLNPRFQRRDAWSQIQKSLLIESLITGLPVPQIVLASLPGRKGKFLVLDGKQRLLTLLQFWGLGEGPNNGFKLRGLQILDREQFAGKSLHDLRSNSKFADELNALENQTLRTVMIQAWPNESFLHTVFLRLNTGSKRLSPQELRQALHPGPFTNWVDDAASESNPLKDLLGLSEPDYRMRDVELLARSLAFRFSITQYGGRMKRFLDEQFRGFNQRWSDGAEADGEMPDLSDVPWSPLRDELDRALHEFDAAVISLTEVFGLKRVARKPDSRAFNRAVFDALIYVAVQPGIAEAMKTHSEALADRYNALFEDDAFRKSVELDTASTASTVQRIAAWGRVVSDVTGHEVQIPALVQNDEGSRVEITTTGEV
jgi:hypothetical protein